MKRDALIIVATLAAPIAAVLVFPQLIYMSKVLLFVGASLFVTVYYRSTFRQDKRGIFLEFSDPDKFLAMKPNATEKMILEVAVCLLVDAVLVVFVSGHQNI